MTKLEKEIAALEAEREELERLAQELENDEVYDIDEYEDDRFLNGVPYDQLSFIGKIRCKMKPILRKLYIPRCICSFAALTAFLPRMTLSVWEPPELSTKWDFAFRKIFPLSDSTTVCPVNYPLLP